MRETHQGDAIVPDSGNLCLLAKEDDETGFSFLTAAYSKVYLGTVCGSMCSLGL